MPFYFVVTTSDSKHSCKLYFNATADTKKKNTTEKKKKWQKTNLLFPFVRGGPKFFQLRILHRMYCFSTFFLLLIFMLCMFYTVFVLNVLNTFVANESIKLNLVSQPEKISISGFDTHDTRRMLRMLLQWLSTKKTKVVNDIERIEHSSHHTYPTYPSY